MKKGILYVSTSITNIIYKENLSYLSDETPSENGFQFILN
jgi:hypothetical protein